MIFLFLDFILVLVGCVIILIRDFLLKIFLFIDIRLESLIMLMEMKINLLWWSSKWVSCNFVNSILS